MDLFGISVLSLDYLNLCPVTKIRDEVPSRAEVEEVKRLAAKDSQEMKDPAYENVLSGIDRHRREWEEAREKAEEMAQIFDSLIITSRTLAIGRINLNPIVPRV